MKPTKEVTSLCKQVAKKHRKKIEYGDWYWSNSYGNTLLAMDYGFKPTEQEFAGVFKIWTISDCISWLKEKDWSIYDMSWIGFCEARVRIVYIKPKERSREFEVRGDTLLVACLKAVLAVLEESSG